MNVREIREFLLGDAQALKLNPDFKHDAYFDNERCRGELTMVKHERYLPRLAKLISLLRPKRLLTIGALYGTTESYLLQTHPTWLDAITICDVDLADYNPNRDNGSVVYRNICGTQYGKFQGIFNLIRGSSRDGEVMDRIIAGGPYDVAFVDGEHSSDAVQSDMTVAAQCLAPKGTILVHDTCLFSSSVPEGWDNWAKTHAAGWTCDAVPDPEFFLGLGFVQRTADQ